MRERVDSERTESAPDVALVSVQRVRETFAFEVAVRSEVFHSQTISALDKARVVEDKEEARVDGVPSNVELLIVDGTDWKRIHSDVQLVAEMEEKEEVVMKTAALEEGIDANAGEEKVASIL